MKYDSICQIHFKVSHGNLGFLKRIFSSEAVISFSFMDYLWLYGLLQNQTFFFLGEGEENLHKKVRNWDRCLRSKMKWTAVSFI